MDDFILLLGMVEILAVDIDSWFMIDYRIFYRTRVMYD